MRTRTLAIIGAAALALALGGCTAPEPAMRAGPVLAYDDPAPQPATASLVDICGREGVAAFHRRLATAPPSPIANAEASLDARAAAQRCLDRATAAPRPRTWRPPD